MTPPSVDVARLLDEGRWGWFQKRVLLLAALAFAVDGFSNQVLGLAIPAMIADWHVERDAFAAVLALGLAGLAIGTVIGGMLGDRFGRRPALIGSVLLFGVATMAIASIHSMSGLIALRIIGGLGLGAAVPCATSLIAEYTPARSRSLAISIGMIFIPLGGILSGGAAVKLLGATLWRPLFVAAGGCSVLVALVLLAALPESPRFLLRRPKRHETLRALLARFGHTIEAGTTLAEDASGRKLSVPIAQLFETGVRRDTLALWAAFFACLLATYTMQSWAPTAYRAAGIGLPQIGGIMAAFGFGGIVGSLAAGAAIDRLGSRLTIGLFAAASVAMAGTLGFGHLGAVALMAGSALLGAALSGMQSPLYALAAHVYQPGCRATGVGMASAAGRIGAMASSFTGVATLNAGGPAGFFAFLALAAVCCFVAILPIRRHIIGRSG